MEKKDFWEYSIYVYVNDLTLICSLKGATFMYRKKCKKNRQWLLVIDGVVIKLVCAVYLILPRSLAFHLG